MEDSTRKKDQESRIAAMIHDLDTNLEPYFFDSPHLHFEIRVKRPVSVLTAAVTWDVIESESLSDNEITFRLLALAHGHTEKE